MKSLVPFILMTVLSISCKSQKDTFQPIANNIKKYFLENIPDIKNVDALYILVDTVTPRSKCIHQSAEYKWASTEAKRLGNADSTILENKSDSIIDLIDNFDSTTFLYYRARPLVIYTKNNMEKGMAEQWFFFDKEFKLIPKYSFIEKIAKVDATGLHIEDYVPLTPEDYKCFAKIGMLEYRFNQ